MKENSRREKKRKRELKHASCGSTLHQLEAMTNGGCAPCKLDPGTSPRTTEFHISER